MAKNITYALNAMRFQNGSLATCDVSYAQGKASKLEAVRRYLDAGYDAVNVYYTFRGHDCYQQYRYAHNSKVLLVG